MSNFTIQLHIDSLLKTTRNYIEDKTVRRFIVPSLITWLIFLSLIGIISVFVNIIEFLSFIPFVGPAIKWVVSQFQDVTNFLLFGILKFFIITILSPINCLLSDYIYERETGVKFKDTVGRFFKLMMRSMLVALVCVLVYYLTLALLWGISFFIPFEGFNKLISYFISCIYLSFAFFDYNFERYDLPLKSCFSFLKKHLIHFILVGLVFNLLFLIPYLGVIIAPFIVTIYSTIVFSKLNKSLS